MLRLRLLTAIVLGQLCFAALAHAGLKAYWTFDNTVVDSTGNITVNGILEPLASPAGFSASASPFGGSGSLNVTAPETRFRVPDQPGLTGLIAPGNDFTMSMWINPNASGANFSGRIFDTRGRATLATEPGIQLAIDENGAGAGLSRLSSNSFVAGTGAGTNMPVSTSTFSDSAWHHIAMAYNASANQLSVYVDGVYALTANPYNISANGNFTSTKGIIFGAEDYLDGVLLADNFARQQKFTGLIDEVAIWNDLLTTTQIQQLANGTLLPSSFLPLSATLTPEPMSIAVWSLTLGVAVVFSYVRRRRWNRASSALKN